MNAYVISILIVFTYFTVLFIIAQFARNNSIVDIGWGPGFVLLAWAQYFFRTDYNLLIPALVTLWGFRLFFHIALRNIGKAEDYRYVNMRKSWGKHIHIQAFLRVFMIQGFFQYIVALSIITSRSVLVNSVLIAIGTFIFAFGLVFESVSDHQLRKFVKSRKDKEAVMETGLWRFTRHPNYFGEATLWWGIFLIGLGYGAPFYSILAPLTITILVRYVSGVPFIEERYADNKAFQAYAQKTSVFIPKPPRT